MQAAPGTTIQLLLSIEAPHGVNDTIDTIATVHSVMSLPHHPLDHQVYLSAGHLGNIQIKNVDSLLTKL